VAARVALGILFLMRTTPLGFFFASRRFSDAAPLFGWPDGAFHLSGPLSTLPVQVAAALALARTLAALCFAVGVEPFASGIIAGGLGYAAVLRDPFLFDNTLHVLFLGTILLALACRQGGPGLSLVRLWIASIYLWAALSKLRTDWLDGRTLALLHDERLLRGALSGWIVASPGRRIAAAWSVVGIELALGPLLLAQRSRTRALVLAFGFHGVLEVVAAPDQLSWQMAALLLVFLPSREDQSAHRVEVGGETISPSPHISSTVRGPENT
jgi:hypothetical protein